MTDLADDSYRYLCGRLSIVEARVSAAVARRRAVDPDPEDRFRGLYISDAHVDELLSGPRRAPQVPTLDLESSLHLAQMEEEADEAELRGAELRLRQLGRSFLLEASDVELLLIALAPDLDPRFERLYAYLQDDVSRRRASTGLALELCGGSLATAWLRSRFDPGSVLVAGGLLLIEEGDRPFLTRSLRVPDRVTSHVLGNDAPDPTVASVMTSCVEAQVGGTETFERALHSGTRLYYLRERVGSAGHSYAATALARAAMPTVAIDLLRLGTQGPAEIAAAAAREARLRGAGLVAGPIDRLAEMGPEAVRVFAEAPCTVVLTGARNWDPVWARDVALILDAPITTSVEREAMWLSALDEGVPVLSEVTAATAPFRLTPEQVVRAARAACQQATAEARPILGADLQAGAKAQNAAGLERLARCVEPAMSWDDLVLPKDVLAHLEQLTARARHRDLVLGEWGMGAKTSKGRGIAALFAGDSGTGKTMSAEVVAGSLGLNLYVIDLSTVIDKYIGETEKNLDRIFVEADRVNGVLLFDEADAIFGKRSDVKDSHDRYANVEIAYLLQRMELFDGLAILTTNLRSNVDEAFTRRLDSIVDFPMPEAADRRRLWAKNLKPKLPRAGDIDIDFLASAFKLSGGNIRNVTVSAAYLAASEGRGVTMTDLIRGTEDEYRKLGRMCVEAEFGPYFPMIATGSNGVGRVP